MNIALVHDYLFEQGGAENVFAVFARMFPTAPVYTSIYAAETVSTIFQQRHVHTSFLQHLTTDKRKAKALLPLYPWAFARMKLRGFNLVLSSSSSFAKGIDVDGARHVCYCHTPPRFLWQPDRYVNRRSMPGLDLALQMVTGLLRRHDRHTAGNVDLFIANSHVVQRRIQQVYQRDAVVIHPPIDVREFHISPSVASHYVIVSRLLPYKRVDLAIQACNRLRLPLTVIGDGPDRARLERLAGRTVTMRGRLPRQEVVAALAQSRALIVPGEEDFGLTPLEANASGRPVVAYRGGGALETVVEGSTGWFFDEPTVDSLVALLRRVEGAAMPSPQALRAHAARFDQSAFEAAIRQTLAACC